MKEILKCYRNGRALDMSFDVTIFYYQLHIFAEKIYHPWLHPTGEKERNEDCVPGRIVPVWIEVFINARLEYTGIPREA